MKSILAYNKVENRLIKNKKFTVFLKIHSNSFFIIMYWGSIIQTGSELSVLAEVYFHLCFESQFQHALPFFSMNLVNHAICPRIRSSLCTSRCLEVLDLRSRNSRCLIQLWPCSVLGHYNQYKEWDYREVWSFEAMLSRAAHFWRIPLAITMSCPHNV